MGFLGSTNVSSPRKLIRLDQLTRHCSLGFVVQLIHLVVVPETRIYSLLDKEAKQIRIKDPVNFGHIYGPGELKVKQYLKEHIKHAFKVWYRPFYMFATEPIVFSLSMLSGFSDALIFVFITAFQPVFQQWGFGTIAHGLTFVPINLGYIVAFLIILPWLRYHANKRRQDPDSLSPESRLTWLCWTVPLLTIGLAGFAGTSLGPPIHWALPMFFVFLIAIANYNIYLCTVDYMVAAYGPFSASATGGNALARDFLAGVSAFWAGPFYQNVPPKRLHLVTPTLILMALAFVFTIAVYVIRRHGVQIRARSKMAQDIGDHRKEQEERRHSMFAPGVTTEQRLGTSAPPTRQGTPEPSSHDANAGSGTVASSSTAVNMIRRYEVSEKALSTKERHARNAEPQSIFFSEK